MAPMVSCFSDIGFAAFFSCALYPVYCAFGAFMAYFLKTGLRPEKTPPVYSSILLWRICDAFPYEQIIGPSPLTLEFDETFSHQKVEITCGRSRWTSRNALIIRVGHLSVYF